MEGILSHMRTRPIHWLLSAFGAIRQLLVGPYSLAILTCSENGLLLVPKGDMFVGRKLCFKGSYDRENLDVLLQAINGDSRVLVVGTHVGALAIPLAKKAKSLEAVEANPATAEFLRMNVLLNGLINTRVHNLAAGDRTGKAEMLASRLNTGGSKLKMGNWNQRIYVYDKPDTVEVEMRRLDDVFPGATFDMIVMDIEGSEALALRGMPEVLSRCRMLMVEIVEHHLRNIAKVSNQEFLGLLAPHFDEAFILADSARESEKGISGRVYQSPAFEEMMTECLKRGSANVLFRKACSSGNHKTDHGEKTP